MERSAKITHAKHRKESALHRLLHDIFSAIPASTVPSCAQPLERSRSIAKNAAVRAMAVSGLAAAPPGPWALATIIPDLVTVWKIQAQMVADIASCYGKSAVLTREAMLYCLFRHGMAQLARDIIARTGERILVRRVTLRAFQTLMQKLGIKITQRVVGRGVVRFLPLVGAMGIGAYAYYDTMQVAATTLDLFSKDLELEAS